MTTLLLSTWALPAARALADAAREAGWQACAFDERAQIKPGSKVVFYGGTDLALAAAGWFELALLEPQPDRYLCPRRAPEVSACAPASLTARTRVRS